MIKCWQKDPAARPSFRVIQERLAKAQRPEEQTDPETVSWAMKERPPTDHDAPEAAAAAANDVDVSFDGRCSTDSTPDKMAVAAALVRAQSRARLVSQIKVPMEEKEAEEKPKCGCVVQ